MTDNDFKIFKRDIEFIKTTHASGIVCGILTKDNNIDVEKEWAKLLN
ncbi:copper homeostasis protein CutC [Spiroplasma endosymbiont of Melieria omissa]